MDKPKTTPKDFFLWVGAMIALYASVFAFISLIFDYLNYAFPDALQYYASDPYSGGVSYEMASLIVLFPIFIVLMHLIHRDINRDASRADTWVRRWALYLTLFIAAATLAADLITLIMYFFNGDVSLRFILKVLVIFLVAGGGFLHFLADLRGYWEHNAHKARVLGWAACALVVITIAAGFLIIGTPWQARLYRFDEQKVNDLTTIQYQIVNYWQAKQHLPAALFDLSDSISGFSAPLDPQSSTAYEYNTKGPLSFELCATFNAPTVQSNTARTVPMMAPTAIGAKGVPIQDNWQHGAGHVCFERTIDPSLYPPLNPRKP